MLLLLMMGMTRCASADLCPSDQEILEAVRAEGQMEAWALSQVPEYEQALIVSLKATGISDVICGEPIPANPPAVSCKFTVHYRTHVSYQVSRMTRDGDWKIDQTMAVARRR